MTLNCSKCNGTGFIGGFSHVDEGKCFDCGGAGTLVGKEHTKNYSVEWVRQYFGEGFFKGDGKVKVKSLRDEGETSEWMAMMDDDFYYIGQPVCGGSIHFKFPKDKGKEFVSHFKKTHFNRGFNFKD
jgi:hypothetical protein